MAATVGKSTLGCACEIVGASLLLLFTLSSFVSFVFSFPWCLLAGWLRLRLWCCFRVGCRVCVCVCSLAGVLLRRRVRGVLPRWCWCACVRACVFSSRVRLRAFPLALSGDLLSQLANHNFSNFCFVARFRKCSPALLPKSAVAPSARRVLELRRSRSCRPSSRRTPTCTAQMTPPTSRTATPTRSSSVP